MPLKLPIAPSLPLLGRKTGARQAEESRSDFVKRLENSASRVKGFVLGGRFRSGTYAQIGAL